MPTQVKFNCAHCGKVSQKYVGHVNRARALGLNVYCNRTCAGFGRRKTDEEKKRLKAVYDKEYRTKNFERVKKVRADYFKRDYAANPEKYKRIRQVRMAAHVEYCRQAKYKAYKKEYDKKYRAKKEGGEFWESLLLVDEIQSLYNDAEIRQQNNLHNKSQKRKRKWKTQLSLQRTI